MNFLKKNVLKIFDPTQPNPTHGSTQPMNNSGNSNGSNNSNSNNRNSNNSNSNLHNSNERILLT